MTTNKPKILVVDDERGMRDFLSILLRSEGYAVECVSSGGAAKEIINQTFFDLIITDIKMPDMSGIDLLEYIRGYYSWETAVIMITAYSSTQTAIKALKLGAYDYMCKPFDVEEFKLVVRNALERRRLMQENIYLKKELRIRHDFSNIIGNSSKMLDLFDLIKRVADTGSTMLIVGESGTGKELVAKAIHFQSRRRDKNFVSINCGAMPENLLESELFGHVKGAFTGAIGNKHGLFEVADGGTLLLDEIGDMSPAMQVKLLRVLQDKKIRRVGGTEEVQVDARILAATNKDLRKLVEKGTFREDLYYRINVIEIQIPPLRERREDIPLLVDFFLAKCSNLMGKTMRGISGDAMKLMMEYPWPGNVRELESVIERAVALENTDIILSERLPEQLRGGAKSEAVVDALPEGESLESYLDTLRKKYLIRALERAGGRQKEAAESIGMSFRSLRYYLKKFNLK